MYMLPQSRVIANEKTAYKRLHESIIGLNWCSDYDIIVIL